MARTKRVKTSHTSSGLKKTLFEEIDLLRNGKTKPQQLNAVSKAASQIVSVAKLELEVDQFEHKKLLETKTPSRKRKTLAMA